MSATLRDIKVSGSNLAGSSSQIYQDGGSINSQGSVVVDGTYTLDGKGQLQVSGNIARGDFAADATGTLVVGRHAYNNAPSFYLADLATLTTTHTFVGYQGSNATFRQAGFSTHNVGTLYLGFSEYLSNYGITSHGTGSYVMEGGTLSAVSINVRGTEYDGYSTFKHSGGNVVASSSVTLINGVWTMTGGSLSSGGYLTVGEEGYGSFAHEAGVVQAIVLRVGNQWGSHGDYTMGVNAASLTTTSTVLGYQGSGTFVQRGGVHTTSNLLMAHDIGGSVQSNATYRLEGGALIANDVVVADGGAALFSQVGGIHTVANTLTLGRTGVFAQLAKVPGTGTYQLENGSLSAKNEVIGDYGVGLFKQTGGSNTVSEALVLGQSVGFFSRGDGTYQLVNGTLSAKSEAIGVDGTALFKQTGGTNTTDSLSIGKLGQYVLSNGTLTVNGNLVNQGSFKVTGGQFTVAGDVVNSGVWDVRAASMTFSGNTEFAAGSTTYLGADSVATYTGLVKLRTGALFTGEGTRVYAGGLSVGNSPGQVTESGDVVFAASNSYLAEIGGLLPGTGYDHYAVKGDLTLGGTLVITSWHGFTGEVGQTYDLFDWRTVHGTFANIDFSALQLKPGAKLDLTKLYQDGSVSVVAVPEPDLGLLVIAGMAVVGAFGRRRQASA